jgi:hypothetical protein
MLKFSHLIAVQITEKAGCSAVASTVSTNKCVKNVFDVQYCFHVYMYGWKEMYPIYISIEGL